MSWLELDDRILDHPKFIRAVKLGGSDAVFLWLGIRSYCGQLLTDGFVPSDMIDEVRGPREPKKRAAALSALIEVRLLDEVPGGYEMHDYLDWSMSRADVLKRRKTWKDKKNRQRGGVTDQDDSQGLSPGDSEGDATETPRGVPDPRARARGIGSGSGEGDGDPDLGGGSGGLAAGSAHPWSPAPAVTRPSFAHVGAATPAFLAVFDRYPRKDAKQEAAIAFQEIAASYPGGEEALSRAILAAFDAGMLKRAPYAGPNDKRPFLARMLSTRRWEDPVSDPDNGDPRCQFHRQGFRGKLPREGAHDGCPECKHAQAARSGREGDATSSADLFAATARKSEELRQAAERAATPEQLAELKAMRQPAKAAAG